MKLYLSSYRIPTPGDLVIMLAQPLATSRTAVISNAMDYHLPELRAQKLDELCADLAKLGIGADIIDLRDYEDTSRLKDVLNTYDLLWIAGGNTYVLRSEMRRSGFDKIIQDIVNAGCVYGGESAGAIVAGASLEGFEVADDPGQADELVWDGLGLTDRIIAPHMDNPNFIEYVNHIKKLYAEDPRIAYLNDNQALVISGDEQRLTTRVV